MSQKKGAVPTSTGKDEKISGFIDLISQIEGYYIMERQSGGIPGDLNTSKHKLEFWTVGFFGVMKTFLISLIVVPACVGVFCGLVPVYGSYKPDIVDYAIVVLMSISFCLGYSLFLARLGGMFEGQYTKSMIKNFLLGVTSGAIIKILLAMGIYHYVALFVLNREQLARYLLKLEGVFGMETLESLYVYLLQWKTAVIISAWWVSITTLMYIIIPWSAVLMKKWSDKQKLAMGGRQI